MWEEKNNPNLYIIFLLKAVNVLEATWTIWYRLRTGENVLYLQTSALTWEVFPNWSDQLLLTDCLLSVGRLIHIISDPTVWPQSGYDQVHYSNYRTNCWKKRMALSATLDQFDFF